MKPRGLKSIGSLSFSVLLVSSLLTIANSSARATETASVNPFAKTDGSDEVAAASGSNVFVVWIYLSDIYLRRSTDNGATWQPAVNLSNNPGGSHFPQIEVSGSHVYVVWLQENAEGKLPNIFFRHSADNGAAWGQKVKISSSGTNLDAAPKVAASGSNVYVVWHDEGSGNGDIFFRRSTDNGATWKPIVQLIGNRGPSLLPHIAVSESNLYAVWYQENADDTSEDIFFRRSTDGGATWKPKINLSDSAQTSSSFFPQIATSGPNVYVAWPEDPSESELDVFDIFFRRSTDNGASWKAIKNLSNNDGISYDPQIAVSASYVYVAWTDQDTVGRGDILTRRSTDNGAAWLPVDNLSNNPQPSADPHIAVAGSNVYIAWNNENSDAYHDILFRRSTDNGAAWKAVVNLSNNDETSRAPQAAAAGSKVYVVWMDESASEHTGFDIFFRRSTDNGATWKSVKVLTTDCGALDSCTLGQIAI